MAIKKKQKLTLTTDAIKKHDTEPGIFMLLAISAGLKTEQEITRLLEQGLIGRIMGANGYTGDYFLTDAGVNLINKVIYDSDEDIPGEEELLQLATDLQQLFPKGKKPGTIQYWRGSQKEIFVKLQGFYKRYGRAFSSEEIINATRRYVDSFNGNYGYMQLLKYFIWKDKDNGEKISELASGLENYSEDEVNYGSGETWASKLT